MAEQARQVRRNSVVRAGPWLRPWLMAKTLGQQPSVVKGNRIAGGET
jgi:hypothetical protein